MDRGAGGNGCNTWSESARNRRQDWDAGRNASDACIAGCDRAAPNNHLTFLVTSQGQPFTDAGFTNWFRDRCNEAGLPKGISAHGLRKARARRIAEQGGTAHEIAAVTGHTSLGEGLIDGGSPRGP
jgi:integrase